MTILANITDIHPAVFTFALFGVIIAFGPAVYCGMQLVKKIRRRPFIKAAAIKSQNVNEHIEHEITHLIDSKLVEMNACGESITKVTVEIFNYTPKRLRIAIRRGMYFVSTGWYQNMAVTEDVHTDVEPHDENIIHVSVACLNAERPIPQSINEFSGIKQVSSDLVSSDLARFLEASRSEDPVTVQAGVWAITDNYQPMRS